MLAYVARRALLAVPTLFLVALAVFVLVRLVPGDPAQVILGEGGDVAALAALRIELGLDRPLPVQFALWLKAALVGDFGISLMTGEPVTQTILDRFAVSAPVVFAAMAIATAVSVAGGLLAASRQNRFTDVAVVTLATVALSVPTFWLGLLLLLVFGIELGWVPVVGYASFAEDPLAAARYLILPVLTLAIVEAGVLTRMMRASSLDVMRLDYVLHARAKGFSGARIMRRHVFPNAFAPTLTLVGLMLGNLLGGIAVVETVFTLPGLGRLMVDAVLARDYPVIQGCLLFAALLYMLCNLLVDLIYPRFDPRVAVQ
jgi:peptide/nickel transport system permease protein